MSDQTYYQPDPAAETQALVDAFFEALADTRPEQGGLRDRLRVRHERLRAEQQHRVIDEPSRHNLSMSLAIVALYRELSPEVGDDQLIPLLREAFIEPLRPMLQAVTGSMLDQASDAFVEMVNISKQREQHAFGAGFAFVHPSDDDERYVVQVERCYYHDVLSANGVPQLTPILCAFDSNWIGAIDPGRRGFEFERPTTIGMGGPNCPFRFTRTKQAK